MTAILSTLDSLKGESDRGAIIVAGSFIDEALKELILSKLAAGPASTKLFDRGRDTDTVFGKLLLARALGLISKSERRDISDLNDVRNRAAHVSLEFTIDDTLEKLSKRLISNWAPHLNQIPNEYLIPLSPAHFIAQISIVIHTTLMARRAEIEQIQLRP